MITFTNENYSQQDELDAYGDIIIAGTRLHKIGDLVPLHIRGVSQGIQVPIIRISSLEEFLSRKPYNEAAKDYPYFYAVIAE